MHFVREFRRRMVVDETGQNIVEYALVTALVGAGAMAVLRELGINVAGTFYTLLIKGATVFFNVS